LSGINKIRQAKKLLLEAQQDQSCEMCREDLGDIVNAVEQTDVKISRMTNMVDEMSSKGILDADEKLQARFKSIPSPTKPLQTFNQITGGDTLGISEVAADIAGMVDDVKEFRQIGTIVKSAPDALEEAFPNPLDPLDLVGRNANKLKLPRLVFSD
jgi:hypothetical protein